MRLLSPILQRVVYPAVAKVGYFHWRSSSALRVITYHGVLPERYRSADHFLDSTLVNLPSFRSQLALLKRHYNVISPERFLSWLRKLEKLPERAVLLTCDDGLLNNLTIMAPVLQEEGLQCLFFVTGRSAGNTPAMLWYVELYLMLMEARGTHQPFDWRGLLIPAIPADRLERIACWLQLMKTLSRFDGVERLDFVGEAARRWGLDSQWKRKYLDDPLLRQRFQLLCTQEVRRLAEAGMTIGAHTMSHLILAEQSSDLARAEIADCRTTLERCSGQPVWALAYAFGDPASVGNREYQLAESAGYECAFVNVGGPLGKTFSRFALPRIHVTAEMSLPVYEAHISGFHDSLQRRLRRPSSDLNKAAQPTNQSSQS
jgi:peptidoglycan/xylan/chitin deacetylase (PgdA/CDA1 family)